MGRSTWVVLWAVMATAACTSRSPTPAVAFPSGTLIDLTHPFDDQMIVWPTSERFRLEKVADGVTEQGYYYAANNFFAAEHGGTHLDAPIHFAAGHQTVDQIPLDRLTGPAIVIDVTAESSGNSDYQAGVADFEAWERAHNAIPPGAILVIRTGFSSRWPDPARYLGTAERGSGALPKLHFPGLHPDAARWLVANRAIDAIGIDTASIDYGQSTRFESHRVLYDRNIPAFENLTNLDRVPATGAFIIALPMHIRGGSGAPLRAMAIVPRADYSPAHLSWQFWIPAFAGMTLRVRQLPHQRGRDTSPAAPCPRV